MLGPEPDGSEQAEGAKKAPLRQNSLPLCEAALRKVYRSAAGVSAALALVNSRQARTSETRCNGHGGRSTQSCQTGAAKQAPLGPLLTLAAE